MISLQNIIRMKQHLVIVRTGANVLNLTSYNCQELGLAKALTKKGLKVSLILAGNKKQVEKISCEGGVVCVYFLKFSALDQRFGYFWGVSDLLKSLAPSIIQVHDLGVFMTWYVTKWAHTHSVPCYLIQGTYQYSPRIGIHQIERMYASTFGKYVLNNVAGIGCKTIKASEFLKNILDCRTRLTYIGLDESKFYNRDDTDWKHKLGIENKHILLYIGILEERRNPDFLIDIIKNLGDNYALVLVGEGPLSQRIRDVVINSNLQDRVFMLGRLQQNFLPKLYEDSDLFLLASSYEIYGMVILESMYFGLPIISSLTAGAETIIESNVDGVVIPVFDVRKWCAAIKAICSNKDELEKMKFKAKSKIKEKLLWSKAAEAYLELYSCKKC